MTFGSLFSGIGGIDLGLERAGMECRWQVEIDPFCQQVLRKQWPKIPVYEDITKITGAELEPVDLICGGFPCQDLSLAGKRAGITGSRSGLWFEFARLVGELRPRWVLVENVPGLLTPRREAKVPVEAAGISRVVGELARLGYVGIWLRLAASDVGASHLRKRIFIVAYRNRLADTGDGQFPLPWWEPQMGDGLGSAGPDIPDAGQPGLPDAEHQSRSAPGPVTEFCGAPLPFAPGPDDPRWPAILSERPDLAPALSIAEEDRIGINQQRFASRGKASKAPSQSEICGVADGVPTWLDRAMSNRTKRLKALGNVVVPQCAEYVGRLILAAEEILGVTYEARRRPVLGRVVVPGAGLH